MGRTAKQTKTTSKNTNTKKATSKKKTTNQNKKSVETPKDTNSEETTEESKVSNDSTDSSNKNKLTSKRKKIIYLSLGASLLGLSIGIPTIIVCTKLNENKNQIFFKDSDFVYLRKQIINLVDKEHMSVNSFEKVMIGVFKEYLLVSNVSISNLIQNVEIQNYQVDSISFKITLDSNYEYEISSTNNEITISKNILLISYTALNSIKFYD